MNIEKSTQAYAAWLGEHTTLAQADLDFKHQQMTTGAFLFLRPTFHRLGGPLAVPTVQKDLTARHAGWLSAMIESTEDDFQAWKKNGDK